MPKPLRVCQLGFESGEHALDPQAVRYVVRVHRSRPGAELLLFDPERGVEALARLTSDGHRTTCRVGELRPGSNRGLRGLDLYVGLSKAKALERAVRDAVALGVSQLTLLASEYAVPAPPDAERFAARLRTIAIDEARQSERSNLPTFEGPLALDAALDRARAFGRQGRHCLLDPRSAAPSLSSELSRIAPDLDEPHALGLWVGPEGGFSDAERTSLSEGGVSVARLGSSILRVPLAVAVALGTVVVWSDARGAEPWARRDDVR
jgi:16S rRNA (uracil1498-N3)-methyltransferase